MILFEFRGCWRRRMWTSAPEKPRCMYAWKGILRGLYILLQLITRFKFKGALCYSESLIATWRGRPLNSLILLFFATFFYFVCHIPASVTRGVLHMDRKFQMSLGLKIIQQRWAHVQARSLLNFMQCVFFHLFICRLNSKNCAYRVSVYNALDFDFWSRTQRLTTGSFWELNIRNGRLNAGVLQSREWLHSSIRIAFILIHCVSQTIDCSKCKLKYICVSVSKKEKHRKSFLVIRLVLLECMCSVLWS